MVELNFEKLFKEVQNNPAELERVFLEFIRLHRIFLNQKNQSLPDDIREEIVADACEDKERNLRESYTRYLSNRSQVLEMIDQLIKQIGANTIDSYDEQIFAQTVQWCNPEGCVVILRSCSNGEGREKNPDNLANFLRKVYAGENFKIFSADKVAFGCDLVFDGQKIVNVIYGNAGTYIPRQLLTEQGQNFLTSE
jgi:hypothetical protein